LFIPQCCLYINQQVSVACLPHTNFRCSTRLTSSLMPSQSDNNIDDAAHARSAGSIGSEGFRAAFHIAASSRPAESTAGRARYVKTAEHHSQVNSFPLQTRGRSQRLTSWMMFRQNPCFSITSLVVQTIPLTLSHSTCLVPSIWRWLRSQSRLLTPNSPISTFVAFGTFSRTSSWAQGLFRRLCFLSLINSVMQYASSCAEV
jgi:hypothetical protein